MKQNAWLVVLNDRVVNVVYYDADCTAQYVRDSLINHDGYSTGIKVIRSR